MARYHDMLSIMYVGKLSNQAQVFQNIYQVFRRVFKHIHASKKDLYDLEIFLLATSRLILTILKIDSANTY